MDRLNELIMWAHAMAKVQAENNQNPGNRYEQMMYQDVLVVLKRVRDLAKLPPQSDRETAK